MKIRFDCMGILTKLRNWYTPRIKPDMVPVAELINWAIGDSLIYEGFSKKEV